MPRRRGGSSPPSRISLDLLEVFDREKEAGDLWEKLTASLTATRSSMTFFPASKGDRKYRAQHLAEPQNVVASAPRCAHLTSLEYPAAQWAPHVDKRRVFVPVRKVSHSRAWTALAAGVRARTASTSGLLEPNDEARALVGLVVARVAEVDKLDRECPRAGSYLFELPTCRCDGAGSRSSPDGAA